MTPARRVYFSVHDVIDAIQNGESDVDMESDTSDSSDEEVVENVEEVEKENQRPTDCLTDDDDGKDIEQTNTSQPNPNICAVKWYDNRAVTLVSSFAGIDPVQKIQRSNKKNPTLKLRDLILWCIQQIHGRCGFAGLIWSQIQVPHEIF